MSFDNLQDIHPLLVKACQDPKNIYYCIQISTTLDTINETGQYYKQFYKPNKHFMATNLIKRCYISGVIIQEISQNQKWKNYEQYEVREKVLQKMLEKYTKCL